MNTQHYKELMGGNNGNNGNKGNTDINDNNDNIDDKTKEMKNKNGYGTGTGTGTGTGSASASNDKLTEIAINIEDVKNIMYKNIDLTIKRGDDLEKLQVKSEALEQNSTMFLRNSKKLKNTMQCKNLKMIAIITMCVLAIIAIIAGTIYGAVKRHSTPGPH